MNIKHRAIFILAIFHLAIPIISKAQDAVLEYNVIRNVNVEYNSIMDESPSFGPFGDVGTCSDDGSYTVDLAGSSFIYAGIPLTSIKISTNGYLLINGPSVNGSGTGISSYSKCVAVFWDDLVSPNCFNGNSALTPFLAYKINGTLGNGANIIIEWAGVSHYLVPYGANLNFQIVLNEQDNSITFNYGEIEGFFGVHGTAGSMIYTYTIGLTGTISNSNNPQPGQVFAQVNENTTNFSPYGTQFADKGSNALKTPPTCFSQLVFTLGNYTGIIDDVEIPTNDEPAAAIQLYAELAEIQDFCGRYYTTRNATESDSIPAGLCNLPYTNSDDDVWFKFQAIDTVGIVKVYCSGGLCAVVEIWNADFSQLIECGTPYRDGQIAAINMSGLEPGELYYARVYHKYGGSNALASVNVLDGLITSLTLENAGSGYFQPNSAAANYLNVTISDSTGVNCIGNVVANGNFLTPGSIANITVLSSGSGYSNNPIVTIQHPSFGYSGDFAIAYYSQSICPFDFQPDFILDVSDLNLLLSNFGCEENCAPFDLDGNGIVGMSDVMIMISEMGTLCGN